MGSRLPIAKRPAAGQPVEELRSKFAKASSDVALRGGVSIVSVKRGASVELHTRREEIETRGRQRKTDGMGMASEACEQRSAASSAPWTAVRASSRWKPGMERPEPWASPSAWVRTRAGRPVRSTTREARMPRTPRCQSGCRGSDIGGVGAGGVDPGKEFLVDGLEGVGFGVAAVSIQSGVEFFG